MNVMFEQYKGASIPFESSHVFLINAHELHYSFDEYINVTTGTRSYILIDESETKLLVHSINVDYFKWCDMENANGHDTKMSRDSSDCSLRVSLIQCISDSILLHLPIEQAFILRVETPYRLNASVRRVVKYILLMIWF